MNVVPVPVRKQRQLVDGHALLRDQIEEALAIEHEAEWTVAALCIRLAQCTENDRLWLAIAPPAILSERDRIPSLIEVPLDELKSVVPDPRKRLTPARELRPLRPQLVNHLLHLVEFAFFFESWWSSAVRVGVPSWVTGGVLPGVQLVRILEVAGWAEFVTQPGAGGGVEPAPPGVSQRKS